MRQRIMMVPQQQMTATLGRFELVNGGQFVTDLSDSKLEADFTYFGSKDTEI